MPAAKLDERFGCRKRIFMLCAGIFDRLLLLALVLLPFFLHGSAVIWGLMAVLVMRSFGNQVCYPAWSALMSDLVPEAIRDRYFGSRNIAVGLTALICAPLAGYLINFGGIPGGYRVSFAVALGIGFVATLLFGMIKEPECHKSRETVQKQRVEILSIAQIGILGSIGAFTGMIGQRIWGVRNDRRGPVWVMRITGFLLPAIPIVWALAPTWWYLPFIEAGSGFIWAGYWLANFNLLLGMSPDANRFRFVAVYHSVVAIASFIGPVLGGILVNMISIYGLFWLAVSLLFLVLMTKDAEERVREGGRERRV